MCFFFCKRTGTVLLLYVRIKFYFLKIAGVRWVISASIRVFFPELKVSRIIFNCQLIWYWDSTGDNNAEKQKCQNERLYDYCFLTAFLIVARSAYMKRKLWKKLSKHCSFLAIYSAFFYECMRRKINYKDWKFNRMAFIYQ